ncbi:YqfQ family protein [Pseudalkalibacillus salsuginis]|uniref:YqfQ family protein n=1 Tax=Pseudalkalibacillus salsuginis TaxID=2910972 RepID=UPI001F16C9D9|nr:YqfQ family protein [Pseudalkalibacillus salsuginis]MCF6408509.1 YqfQ family protein [Pseudalkalibacillus salsuginis]
MYRMPPGYGPYGIGLMSPFGQMMPFRGGFPAARSAGFLTRFLSPNPSGGLNLVGMVENVQKVMKMADTVRPLIQQYGPMVKNIPSMLELLKEYKNYSSDSNSTEEKKDDKKEEIKNADDKKTKSSPVVKKKKSSTTEEKKTSSSAKKTSAPVSSKKSSKKPTKKKSIPKVAHVKPAPQPIKRDSVPKLYI